MCVRARTHTCVCVSVLCVCLDTPRSATSDGSETGGRCLSSHSRCVLRVESHSRLVCASRGIACAAHIFASEPTALESKSLNDRAGLSRSREL